MEYNYELISEYQKSKQIIKKLTKKAIKCGYLIEEKSTRSHMVFLKKIVDDLNDLYHDPKHMDEDNILKTYLHSNKDYAHLFMGRFRYWYKLTDKVDVSIDDDNLLYLDSVTGKISDNDLGIDDLYDIKDGSIMVNNNIYNTNRGRIVNVNYEYDIWIQECLVKWIIYTMFYDKKYSLDSNMMAVDRFYHDYLNLHISNDKNNEYTLKTR